MCVYIYRRNFQFLNKCKYNLNWFYTLKALSYLINLSHITFPCISYSSIVYISVSACLWVDMMNFVSISAVSISIPFQLLEVSLDKKKKSIVKEVWICAQFEINRSPFFSLFVSSSFSAGLLMSENILHHAVSWTQLFLFSYAHECCTLLFFPDTFFTFLERCSLYKCNLWL